MESTGPGGAQVTECFPYGTPVLSWPVQLAKSCRREPVWLRQGLFGCDGACLAATLLFYGCSAVTPWLWRRAMAFLSAAFPAEGWGPVWLRPISFFCCSGVRPGVWRGVVPPRLCVGVVAFLSAAFPGACLATTTLLLFYCCPTVTPRLWGGVVAFLSAASLLELHGQFVCTRFPSPTTLWLAFWACVFQ